MELFISLEDPPTIPFIPLSALSEGFSLYDHEAETKSVDINSNDTSMQGFNGMQLPLYEYRQPEKLLENKSVINNSILIDEEKKIKKKNENVLTNKKVCFLNSPKESCHRRSKSETTEPQTTYKLEIINLENRIDFFGEKIKDEIMKQIVERPGKSNFSNYIYDKSLFSENRISCQDAVKSHECFKENIEKINIEFSGNTNKKYVDPIFLPNVSSIYSSKRSLSSLNNNKFKWERLSNIYKSKCVLFWNIDPNNFNLNLISNTYFLSALSVLAEKPNILIKLFENQEYSHNKSFYFVKICQSGVWRYTTVDDLIPTLNSKPAFISPRFIENTEPIEIYSILIEKAYAKLYSTYQNIEFGSTIETIQELTGAPGSTILLEDFEDNHLMSSLQKGFIVIVGVSKTNDKKINLNLLHYYCYNVLAIENVDFEGKNEKLVKLRNPWGWVGEEWKGKWSREWISNQSKELTKHFMPMEEGIFYLDINDFQDYFDFASICKIHEKYFYNSTTFRHKHSAFSIRKFKITEESNHCYLGISQHDKRYFGHMKNYEYVFVRVLIGRKIDFDEIEKDLEEGGGFTRKLYTNRLNKQECGFEFEYIDGISGRIRDLSIELTLDRGEYYVFVCADWEQTIFDLTLTYYGRSPINFERVDYKKNSHVLDEIIGSYVFENVFPLETSIIEKDMLQDLYKHYIFFAKKEALIIEAFENLTEDVISLSKDYKNLHHIFRLVRNYNDFGNFGNIEMRVNQNKPSFVCIKFTNMDKYNYGGLDKNILKTYGF